MGRYRLVHLLFLASVTVGALLVSPSASQACIFAEPELCVSGGGGSDPCTHEQVIFRKAGNDHTVGARSSVYVGGRRPDLNCAPTAESHSTVHMRDIFDTKWAEIGWVLDVSTGSARWRVFWETGAHGLVTGGGFSYGFQIGCCGWRGYKVLNVQGTGRWKFFYDSGSGVFQQVGPSDGYQAGFQEGTPMGETGRRGPATEADDDHNNLSKKGCDSCNFSPWSENQFWMDTISGYHASVLTPDHYLVVRD